MLVPFKGSLLAVGVGALAVSLLIGVALRQPSTVSEQFASIGGGLVLTRGAWSNLLASIFQLAGSAAPMPVEGSVSYGPVGSNGYRRCVFTDGQGGTMNFLLQLPAPYDSHQKYPLVLMLHGGGERAKSDVTPAEGQDLLANASYVKVWGLPAQDRDATYLQKLRSSFVVVPQLTYPNRWVDVPPDQGSYHLATEPTVELQRAKGIVDLLQREYVGIDPNRLYITGVSLGGYGTWDAIERWPDHFAAAVPVSGGGDPTKAYKLKDLPIWVFHGGADPTVPVSGSRDMVEALRKAGGDPRYTEYAGAGHDIWARVYNISAIGSGSGLFDWLFAQRRTGS